MIVYIAGPISGHADYRERFAEEEKRQREQGHTVLNPAVLPEGLGDLEVYMRICLPMVEIADRLVMLPGWELSQGASREWNHALKLGKEIDYVRTDRKTQADMLQDVKEPLWSNDGARYLTNMKNELIRMEYDKRLRELGHTRYNEIMTERERRQFDRDMIAKYGEACPPPGRAEWLLKVWDFTPDQG